MRDFEVVRVFLKEETEQLRRMQLSAPEFLEHYPRHPEWLSKAIREVLEGTRTAFGVLKYGISKRKKPKIDLVGSIILKHSDFAPAVELKNLYMRPDERHKGYGRALYEKTEEYCAKKGYTTIHTEVPCGEITTIGFLHKMGFRVIEMEPSPYKKGDHIYQMSKTITVMFDGDVFDFASQVQWVLENYYGYLADGAQAAKSLKLFSLAAAIPDTTKVIEKDLATVKGAAVIIDEQTPVDRERIRDAFATSNSNLRMLFARKISEAGLRHCIEYGIKCFDVGGLHSAFGKYFAYNKPPFDAEAIAGMVLVFKPELFDRIGSENPQSFTYFKGGPIGKYLRKGHKALLYVEPTAGHPMEGLCGIADIREVAVGSAIDIWKQFSGSFPLFRQHEYFRFAGSKRCIVGIKMAGFAALDHVKLDTVIEEVLGGEIDIDSVGHLYVDARTVEVVLNAHEEQIAQRRAQMQYKVALSFAGEDRDHAQALAQILQSNGVTVFYDEYEQAALWGKDLYQHLQKVYRDDAGFCVVFLSQHYANKLWARHELKQAQARAFRESKEYILPVKLDDTEIAGINETVAYLDLREITIPQVADLLMQKLNQP